MVVVRKETNMVPADSPSTHHSSQLRRAEQWEEPSSLLYISWISKTALADGNTKLVEPCRSSYSCAGGPYE